MEEGTDMEIGFTEKGPTIGFSLKENKKQISQKFVCFVKNL